ncbi:hypothetical protein BC332_16297 [Capsicum chinense]|nr:hypothetical protein BC332_16297 [Capsicum chinense]
MEYCDFNGASTSLNSDGVIGFYDFDGGGAGVYTAYGLKCKDNKFFSAVEKISRDNISEGDSFYVENIRGDERQYTVFGNGCTVKVDLLERSCSCKKFDLVKIPCVHAMAALRSKNGEDYGLRVYDYSSPLYKVEEYLLVYS